MVVKMVRLSWPQISAGEQTVVESKPDNIVEDLRLHQPWPELAELAASIDLVAADEHTHRHTPFGACIDS
jgi:NEDD8-activating enzyme E1 regulatory subunit